MNSITPASPSAITLSRRELGSMLAPWAEHLALRVQAGELSADTTRLYVRGAEKFLDWSSSLIQPGKGDVILQWKAALLSDGIKVASVNVWLAGVRSFFGWLAEQGQIQFDPTQSIKGASRKNSRAHVRQALTDTEALRLLSQPDRSKVGGIRDYAILALMLYTAVRGIEVWRADYEDLRTVQDKLTLNVQGKGHIEKDALVVLPRPAEDALRDWLTFRGDKPGALFTSMSNRSMDERLSRRALRALVKGHMRRAGIVGKEKTTHSLRHTAISSAIRHGAPAEKVRGMSRHASLDTLMIYYHEADRIADPAEERIQYGE